MKIKKMEKQIDIEYLLKEYDKVFQPSISSRINNLGKYSKKLVDKAYTFVLEDKELKIGFITFYANDFEKKTVYIAFLATSPFFRRKNVGQYLMDCCYKISKELGMENIKLEVHINNPKAIKFYKKNGFFIIGKASKQSYYMFKELVKDEKK